MANQLITVSVDGRIARLTLNRPEKLNALTDEMMREMQVALMELEHDEAVRSLIIAGAGRAFSAGWDLGPHEPPYGTVQEWRQHIRLGIETFLQLWHSRLPIIAAVHGYCLGGGCDLSMVCDLTIAAETAEFGEPEIRSQSAPPFLVMPWVLGMKKTKELLLTGDRISAREAERIGLINRVVPPERLDAEVSILAEKLARIPAPAMHMNKQAINRSYETSGFLPAINSGAETMVLTLLADSAEKQEFHRIAAEHGLGEAFRWRDARFQDHA